MEKELIRKTVLFLIITALALGGLWLAVEEIVNILSGG